MISSLFAECVRHCLNKPSFLFSVFSVTPLCSLWLIFFGLQLLKMMQQYKCVSRKWALI